MSNSAGTSSEGGRADAPQRSDVPLARPVTVAAAQIPMARPAGRALDPSIVAVDGVPVRPPRRWPRLRASIELIVLIPAVLLGGLTLPLVMSLWTWPDERVLNLGSSVGMGLMSLLAVRVMLALRGQRMAAIGWSSRGFVAHAGIGLACLALTYALLMYAAVVISVLFPHLIEPSTTAQQAIEETFPPLDMHWMIGVMLFVGVWEEVVFRGFLLTRLQVLLKRRWLTVLIGAAAFGAVHSYEGPLAMSVIFVLGIVLGTLFVWRRSLVPGVVYHAAHNLIVVRLMHEVSPTWQ